MKKQTNQSNGLVLTMVAAAIGAAAAMMLTKDSPNEDAQPEKGVINSVGLSSGEEGLGDAPPVYIPDEQPVLVDEDSLGDSIDHLSDFTFDSAVAIAAEQNRPLLVVVAKEMPKIPLLPPELLVVRLDPDDSTPGQLTNRERFQKAGNKIPCALLYPSIKLNENKPKVIPLEYSSLGEQLSSLYPGKGE